MYLLLLTSTYLTTVLTAIILDSFSFSSNSRAEGTEDHLDLTWWLLSLLPSQTLKLTICLPAVV